MHNALKLRPDPKTNRIMRLPRCGRCKAAAGQADVKAKKPGLRVRIRPGICRLLFCFGIRFRRLLIELVDEFGYETEMIGGG